MAQSNVKQIVEQIIRNGACTVQQVLAVQASRDTRLIEILEDAISNGDVEIASPRGR